MLFGVNITGQAEKMLYEMPYLRINHIRITNRLRQTSQRHN